MSQVLQWTQFAALISASRCHSFPWPFRRQLQDKNTGKDSVLFDALCCADVCIRDAQMAGLIFLMPGSGVIHIRQPVKRQLPSP